MTTECGPGPAQELLRLGEAAGCVGRGLPPRFAAALPRSTYRPTPGAPRDRCNPSSQALLHPCAPSALALDILLPAYDIGRREWRYQWGRVAHVPPTPHCICCLPTSLRWSWLCGVADASCARRSLQTARMLRHCRATISSTHPASPSGLPLRKWGPCTLPSCPPPSIPLSHRYTQPTYVYKIHTQPTCVCEPCPQHSGREALLRVVTSNEVINTRSPRHSSSLALHKYHIVGGLEIQGAPH